MDIYMDIIMDIYIYKTPEILTGASHPDMATSCKFWDRSYILELGCVHSTDLSGPTHSKCRE
jgi:hypothetical protein